MDAPGFDHFVGTQGERLLRSARLLTGSWHGAEDLTQDVLARLFVAWPRLRAPEAASAYAYRMMVRLHARNASRRWSAEIPYQHLPEVAGTEPPDEDRGLIAILLTLPPRQRAVLVLRFCEDLSVADTATALRCQPGTVKSQTAKALAAVRSALIRHEAERENDAERQRQS